MDIAYTVQLFTWSNFHGFSPDLGQMGENLYVGVNFINASVVPVFLPRFFRFISFRSPGFKVSFLPVLEHRFSRF